MTYSCNGFHEPEAEALYGGIGYLWRDVLSRHAQQPFHLQVRCKLYQQAKATAFSEGTWSESREIGWWRAVAMR